MGFMASYTEDHLEISIYRSSIRHRSPGGIHHGMGKYAVRNSAKQSLLCDYTGIPGLLYKYPPREYP